MTTIGRHLLAEFYLCDGATLDDLDSTRECMLAAVRLIGGTVLGEMFHRFTPHGVSGVVLMAESHLAVHTWPERRYVAMDVYTCGGLDPFPGVAHVARCLQAEQHRVQEIVRGLPADLEARSASEADEGGPVVATCGARLITELTPVRQ
jgi:S-adenosylmethionine decarboxylase